MNKFVNLLIEGYMRFGCPVLCWAGVKYFIPGSPFYENIIGFVAAILGFVAGHAFCGGIRDNE